MPTYEVTQRFLRDYKKLTRKQQELFRISWRAMVDDLKSGRGFRSSLRVTKVQGTRDVWEMTWASDGRATWQYGERQREAEPHVVWRRIGSHDIFGSP